jgi:hypothetical protein
MEPTDMDGKQPSKRAYVVILAAIVFAFLVGVWAIIVVIFFAPKLSLQEFGQFGDMFGFVNALFAGAALLGVLVALYLQVQEIRENVAWQNRQNEMAQKTNRIQALSFLAGLYHNMMETAPSKSQAEWKKKAECCVQSAIALLKELGEFPPEEFADIAAKAPSPIDYALDELNRIVRDLEAGLEGENSQSPDNRRANNVIWNATSALETWWRNYQNELPGDESQRVGTCISTLAAASQVFLRRVEGEGQGPQAKQWGEYWEAVGRSLLLVKEYAASLPRQG